MEDIDLYYESLNEVHNQIVEWRSEKPSLRSRLHENCRDINVGFLVLSVIPIIPIILFSAMRFFDISIWMFDFSEFTLGRFIGLWVGVSLFFLVFIPIIDLAKPKDEEKPKGPPQRLSEDQITFIALYGAYKELKIYFVSHIDHHIERCTSCVSLLFPRVAYMVGVPPDHNLPSGKMERMKYEKRWLHHYGGLPRQISVAEDFLRLFERYQWLKVDDDTKTKIQALAEFPEKVLFRLKLKEDLPSVLPVLESLARFSYAYLPEHQTYMEPATIKAIRTEGDNWLLKFVKEVNGMTSYTMPDKEKPESTARETLIQKAIASGYLDVLVRFLAWFLLIFGLTLVIVYLASLMFVLNSDTMTTLIIGTSVGGAAALCAAPRAGRQKQ